jgi:hypothetical protein
MFSCVRSLVRLVDRQGCFALIELPLAEGFSKRQAERVRIFTPIGTLRSSALKFVQWFSGAGTGPFSAPRLT